MHILFKHIRIVRNAPWTGNQITGRTHTSHSLTHTEVHCAVANQTNVHAFGL